MYQLSQLIPTLIEKTVLGELEGIYNDTTTDMRARLDDFLGERISSYLPHLDTLMRLGGAYIATYMMLDEPLLNMSIAVALAVQPAVSKYMHDQPYIEQGL